MLFKNNFMNSYELKLGGGDTAQGNLPPLVSLPTAMRVN
jgi:hypothetical protein